MKSPSDTVKAPRAAKRAHTTVVHGERIVDPYDWLRDRRYPRVTNRRVLAYLRAENAYHDAFFAGHASELENIRAELAARIPGDDESVPVLENGWYYQSRFREGDDFRTHHRCRPDGEWELFFDERDAARGHDSFELGGMDVSDGNLLAYAADTDGEERFTLRVRDLERHVELTDVIENTIDGPIWVPDSTTFVYVELNAEWRPYRVRAHTVGAPVKDDVVLYEEPDAGFFVDVDLSQDREYLLVSSGDHETSEVRVFSAHGSIGDCVLIAPRRAGHEYDVDHANGRFYIRSNSAAPNFRLMSAHTAYAGEAGWMEVLPAREAVYLMSATPFAKFILLEERENAVDHVAILDYAGEMHRITFPEELSTAEAGDNPEFDVDTVQLRYESMITPHTIYDYDVTLRKLVVRKVERVQSGYDPKRYRTERHWATARDGARVPVSLVYRDDYPMDGTGRLVLYVYGAYGDGMQPEFSRSRLSLLDRGFAYAIAHVRGGDELGRAWYLAGRAEHRWNTFNDYLDVARHLVSVGITSAGRIVASGASAGGEVVGVAVNEAPQLWAAAIAHVPFVDVTTTMLDGTLPLTPIEWPEWGNPREDARAFAYIRSYSPYDNVGAHEYPPIYVTGGLNDPRVAYFEPAKWTAKLRATATGNPFILLHTSMESGHAGKTGRLTRLDEIARELVFALEVTGRPPRTR